LILLSSTLVPIVICLDGTTNDAFAHIEQGDFQELRDPIAQSSPMRGGGGGESVISCNVMSTCEFNRSAGGTHANFLLYLI
jgi:hypothetical protein